MTNVAQVWGYRFPNVDLPIMGLQLRVSEIAGSRGFTVQTWEDDGLGEVHSIWLRLPSGGHVGTAVHAEAGARLDCNGAFDTIENGTQPT